LVHPKSYEYDSNHFGILGPANWTDEVPKKIEHALADMERFFELFANLNEHTRAAAEFFDRNFT
jgi:hypothetical protein